MVDTAQKQSDSLRTSAGAEVTAANAAELAADTSTKELELTHRPWISINTRLVSPVTIAQTGEDFTIESMIHNTGLSPAIQVVFEAEVFDVPLGASDFLN